MDISKNELDGVTRYYIEDKSIMTGYLWFYLHNLHGPACIQHTGDRKHTTYIYCQNNKRQNIVGPAVIFKNWNEGSHWHLIGDVYI